jgi:predicted TPR repeat methyltransferase
MTEFEEKLAIWQNDPRFVAIAGRNTAWEAVAGKYGVELYEAGEHETAAAVFQLLCEQQPLKPFNWSNLGAALSGLGRADDAVIAFGKSLALNPQQAVVQYNLAQILAGQGKLAEAHTAYAAAGQDAGLAEEALLSLGRMYMDNLLHDKAADVFRAAITHFPQSAVFQANLGAALFQLPDLEGAGSAYRTAFLLDKNPGYRENISFISLLQRLIEKKDEAAILAYRREHPAASLPDVLKRAVFYLTTYRHFPAARIAAYAWLGAAPDDAEAAYLIKAISSETLDRAPPGYLRQHFDDYAASFDQALLSYLQYQVPDEIERLLIEKLGADWQGWVLDAGCGTGLLADRLRPFATRLVGLDIAPNMIEISRAKDLYDELILGDLAALPVLTADKFDLVVATDSLIYFGDLVIPFAAIAEVLRPGGWFVLNLELMPGKHYFLMPNGRFKHARIYLEQVRRTHFTLSEMVEVPLRVEAGYPVPGTVLLFQKRA